jgi:hypothetical protein
MILKHKDDVAPMLEELEQLASMPSLSKKQREEIEHEIWMMRAGTKGEKQAAYLIDFDWKKGKNYVVIHDLRVEHEGRVAQIDHLIISRILAFHVIESKAFGQEIRISESGEWETKTRYGWRGIASPVEQNRRHIDVLEAFIHDHRIAPKRLGLTLKPKFHNWVIVSPECPLRRHGKEWDQVLKMDMFSTEFFKRVDTVGLLATLAAAPRIVATETIQQVGCGLIAAHKPAKFNFAAKFGIETPKQKEDAGNSKPKASAAVCESCAAALESKVINFCRLNSKKFRGKLLCQKCQKSASRPGCDGCGVELEDKVIAFCRYNSKRFGGRKLCRTCQRTPVPA